MKSLPWQQDDEDDVGMRGGQQTLSLMRIGWKTSQPQVSVSVGAFFCRRQASDSHCPRN